ncbi:hypothetical protein NQ318_012170 [Aromia moschata]|uniref:Uncharacterized protein n=1 Tax=Aromia moschata TaxID=1265417 RepID=A0AAV8YYA2_9CUCU|nr:hypothetical protein NQ318_012170 [Aromia moschata]
MAELDDFCEIAALLEKSDVSERLTAGCGPRSLMGREFKYPAYPPPSLPSNGKSPGKTGLKKRMMGRKTGFAGNGRLGVCRKEFMPPHESFLSHPTPQDQFTTSQRTLWHPIPIYLTAIRPTEVKLRGVKIEFKSKSQNTTEYQFYSVSKSKVSIPMFCGVNADMPDDS